ncbi:photosystem II biogenesis protein Psp29 [Leptolyngbya sp. AN02str]|uniref:photosystem II biogenesis protein Psp29 n=1 Tax=Leptolyngbya sp. AN02str TaxID=3423363 RepID=UPI003D31DE46
MSDVRTVSDTKKAFYTLHTRPVNSIYRRVVEELMVEMHLLSVNVDFSYDSIYALGVVTAFDNLMQGYRPEADKDSIFQALCQSVGGDAAQYRRDAEAVKADAAQLSTDELMEQLSKLSETSGEGLFAVLRAIANNERFKYSRLFAVGLYTLLGTVNADLLTDEQRRNEAVKTLSEALKVSAEKTQKDLDVYRSNLDKVVQAQAVMKDMLEADRKKKEERQKAKEAAENPPTTAESSQ